MRSLFLYKKNKSFIKKVKFIENEKLISILFTTDFCINCPVSLNSMMTNTDYSYQQPIQSMYLCTLDNQKIKRPQSAVRDNMRVDDISGARSKFI